MLRGVLCVDNHAISFFENMKSIMAVEQYDWFVDEVDLNYIEFQPGKYTGAELENAMEEISRLSFIRLRRYPKGAEIDQINHYEDFVQSQCDCLILYYDGGYLEIYEKEETLIFNTMKLFQSSHYCKAEYITAENDGRTAMYF